MKCGHSEMVPTSRMAHEVPVLYRGGDGQLCLGKRASSFHISLPLQSPRPVGSQQSGKQSTRCSRSVEDLGRWEQGRPCVNWEGAAM